MTATIADPVRFQDLRRVHERSRLGCSESLRGGGLCRDRVSPAGAARGDRLTCCQARGGESHSRRRRLPGQFSDGDQATVTAPISQGRIVSPELGSSRSHLTDSRPVVTTTRGAHLSCRQPSCQCACRQAMPPVLHEVSGDAEEAS